MIIILIVIGLFALEFILPGLWSGLFKKTNSPPPIMRDPELAEKFYERAWQKQSEENWKEAIEQYTQAIKFDSKQAAYFNNRGFCYYFLNEYEEACTDYTRAISIDDTKTTFYENRGHAYIKLAKKYYGLSDWRKAVALGSKEAAEFIAQYERDERKVFLKEKMDKQDDLPF